MELIALGSPRPPAAAGMTCVGITTTQPAAAPAAADHVAANLEEVDVLPGPALRVRGT